MKSPKSTTGKPLLPPFFRRLIAVLNICKAFLTHQNGQRGICTEKSNPLLWINCLVVPSIPSRFGDGRERETHFHCFPQCLNLGKRRGFFSGSFWGLGTGSKPIPELSKLIPPPPSKANKRGGSRQPSVLTVLGAESFLIFSLLVPLSPGASLSRPVYQRLPA